MEIQCSKIRTCIIFRENFQYGAQRTRNACSQCDLHFLLNILYREVLLYFYTLFVQVESTTMAHLNQFILSLGMYFPPVNTLSNQKIVMRHGMSKTRELKVRRCAAHMIELG